MDCRIVGMAWYDAESFQSAKTWYEDREALQESFPEWLLDAERGYQTLVREGVKVVRVNMNFYQFSCWCEAEGFRPSTYSQMIYASVAANQYPNNQYANNGHG